MRRGDFEAFNTNGSLQLIFDPRTGDVEDEDGRRRRQHHPQDRISPIAQKINAFYPLPNGPGNADNYFKEDVSSLRP